MKHGSFAEHGLAKKPVFKRKELRLSQESLVTSGYLPETDNFPLVVEPATPGVNLAQWATGAGEYLERELLRHGAILFRGFGVEKAEGFEAVARAISPQLLDYRERAAPRIEVGKNVYTSTEYPPDLPVPLHHEMSYSHNWPMKIWFFCLQKPLERGATPIANDRVVLHRLDAKLKEQFIAKKVMYARNYGDGPDLSWQDAFQTTDKSVVEEYCRQAHMDFEWKGEQRLRTRQVRPAIISHPKTGEEVWFNHAHMFHVSNLDPALRESLLAELAEEDLPRNSYYGDGSPIEDSVLDEIRGVYNESSVRFSWQEGDVLMLDNMLASHGREPFVGPRKILVSMAEPFTMFS